MHGTLPFEDDVLVMIYRHWLELRGGRLMPSRRDFNPTKLPGFTWPFILLMDVLNDRDQRRYRYRRVGGHFVEALGHDPTGTFLGENFAGPSSFRDYLFGLYGQIVDERRPLYTENTIQLEGRVAPMLTRRLLLPLSGEGSSVNMVMAVHRFLYDPAATPQAILPGARFKLEHKRIVLADA